MSARSKKAKQKSSVRPCPQECGFSLHDKDQHEACPVCLGIVHARRALTEPHACESCSVLRRSTLERRVKFVEKALGKTFVAQQDPLLSEMKDQVSSGSDDELQAEVPATSWADHMELMDELADEQVQHVDHEQPLSQLSAPYEDDDILDVGLDLPGSSDEDQEDLPSSDHAATAVPASQDDASFLSLYRRAAGKLDVEWPSSPPAQKRSRFAGFFLPPEPTTVKNRLPMYPDFVSELTSSWSKPLSTRVTVPGFGQYSDLEGAESAGLVHPPPMEPSLAAYLAPSQNHGVIGPATLPSKHCRFSAGQLEKIYRAQGCAARTLSSVTMLQTYQAMCLAELGAQLPAGSPLTPLLNEVRLATDYILRMSRGVALSVGRGMAFTVVAQRHLWLTLSDVPEKERVAYLDEPVSAQGLFGQSLDAIQAKFDVRKKQTEALRYIIPRRDGRSKATASGRKPSAQPPHQRTQNPVQGPTVNPPPPQRRVRLPSWNKGPPVSSQKDPTPRRKKPQSS